MDKVCDPVDCEIGENRRFGLSIVDKSALLGPHSLCTGHGLFSTRSGSVAPAASPVSPFCAGNVDNHTAIRTGVDNWKYKRYVSFTQERATFYYFGVYN